MIEMRMRKMYRASGEPLADNFAVALFNGGHGVIEFRETDQGHNWAPWQSLSFVDMPPHPLGTGEATQQHQGGSISDTLSDQVLGDQIKTVDEDGKQWINRGTTDCDHDWELCEGNHCCTVRNCAAEYVQTGKEAWVPGSMAFGLMQMVEDGDDGIILTMSGKALAQHFLKDEMDQWLCNLYMAKIDGGIVKVLGGKLASPGEGPDS